MLNSRIPSGNLESAWDRHKADLSLVNPSNRRRYRILVVGTGLAGAAAAAALGEAGYRVSVFTLADSPRRAHSVAAQGGINAAKNYNNDGDSIERLFRDTLKGGDFRAREANVYRLAQLSNDIIDLCTAQGVPFARDYAGYLDNRSFGGAQLSRTFYAKGQTGQQLLLGAYGALLKEANAGHVQIYSRREMSDLVVVDGKARGIITRNTITGEIEKFEGEAVLLCTGGYANVFYLSTNAVHCNVSAAWACHKKGAKFANPCFTQIHPTCIPQHGDKQSKLTLMSESLRNDGRIWVPKAGFTHEKASSVAEENRDYYLERLFPGFGNLVPRDIASRAAKRICDAGLGVGKTGRAVYLDFERSIAELGLETIMERYGNLFDMYERITGEDPKNGPMRIYPASHYTMGGLWVDYNLMTTIDGLFCLGEANFSDHGANRLGASALMQGLADGYFIIPATLPDYFANGDFKKVAVNDEAFAEAEHDVRRRIDRLKSRKNSRTPLELHKKLGHIMWENVGMERNEAGLRHATAALESLGSEIENDIFVANGEGYNAELDKALHLEDFADCARLMTRDALWRDESCGGHFRTEHQNERGDAVRNDKDFSCVSVWTYGQDVPEREELTFDRYQMRERSYY